MGVITALEVQQRNKERVNVYLDNEYAFSLTLMEAAKLRKGQTLSDTEVASLRADDDVHRAVDSAVRFLAHRPRSTAEVRQNLKKKKFNEDVIEQSLSRLDQMGYLDDTAFARFWLENRNMFKPRGTMALRYELRQKGIADNIIEAVLEDLDDYDAAYRAASTKARRMQGTDHKTFRNKVGAFLQRRGFNYGTARDVIEQLTDELVAENPSFFTEIEDVEEMED